MGTFDYGSVICYCDVHCIYLCYTFTRVTQIRELPI